VHRGRAAAEIDARRGTCDNNNFDQDHAILEMSGERKSLMLGIEDSAIESSSGWCKTLRRDIAHAVTANCWGSNVPTVSCRYAHTTSASNVFTCAVLKTPHYTFARSFAVKLIAVSKHGAMTMSKATSPTSGSYTSPQAMFANAFGTSSWQPRLSPCVSKADMRGSSVVSHLPSMLMMRRKATMMCSLLS